MKQSSPPLGFCFDATGTLIEATRPIGETYHEIALQHGVDLPAWRLEDAFRRVLRGAPPRGITGESVEARCRAEIDWWFELIRQTFQATDSTVRFDDFRSFAGALFEVYRRPGAWRIRPGMAEVLAALSAAGYPMCVVSNFDHRLPYILEDVGLNQFFEHIEIPSKHGSRKPDPALFRAAAAALERPLERLVYVGDDAPEVLEAIARQGVRVVEVGTTLPPSALVETLLDPSRSNAPATLPR